MNQIIADKIGALPAEAQQEILDFIEFIQLKYSKDKETHYWNAATEHSLNKIWDNPEDEAYNELLKR